jgi:hypothetical protein
MRVIPRYAQKVPTPVILGTFRVDFLEPETPVFHFLDKWRENRRSLSLGLGRTYFTAWFRLRTDLIVIQKRAVIVID